jgi:hypothetical protein
MWSVERFTALFSRQRDTDAIQRARRVARNPRDRAVGRAALTRAERLGRRASLAHAIAGSTFCDAARLAKPQSVPAIKFSRQ